MARDAQTPSAEKALAVACSAAQAAAEIIIRAAMSKDFSTEQKADRSFVTSTDLAAEQAIFSTVRAAFPNARFLSEESAASYSDARAVEGELWVVDPIDGTTNFSRGHVYLAICIAFAVDGEVQAAVVHAPFLNQQYTAMRGHSALCNGSLIAPRNDVKLEQAIVVTGFPYVMGSLQKTMKRAQAVLTHCYDLRRLGACSVDVCWVASGRLDGYYETVKPWDIAAPGFIARMAGCTVGAIGERKEQAHLPEELCGEEVLVASPALFLSLQRVLKGA